MLCLLAIFVSLFVYIDPALLGNGQLRYLFFYKLFIEFEIIFCTRMAVAKTFLFVCVSLLAHIAGVFSQSQVRISLTKELRALVKFPPPASFPGSFVTLPTVIQLMKNPGNDINSHLAPHAVEEIKEN